MFLESYNKEANYNFFPGTFVGGQLMSHAAWFSTPLLCLVINVSAIYLTFIAILVSTFLHVAVVNTSLLFMCSNSSLISFINSLLPS